MYKFETNEKIKTRIQKALSMPDGIIAFPTDTVWGIGCLPGNEEAVKKIYSIKSRDKNKPLILLGSKIDHLVPYLNLINNTSQKIINKYFPGAVTLVLSKSQKTPDYITAGFNTIGIRVPKDSPIIDILDNFVEGHVLATTSANISGMGATSLKSEVEKSLGTLVDYIWEDENFIPKGIESTVVSVDDYENVKILRQGAVKIII